MRSVIDDNITQFESLFNPGVLHWKFNIDVLIALHEIKDNDEDTDENFTLGLSLLDLVTIVGQIKVLKYLLEKEIPIDHWTRIISVKGPPKVKVVENEEWIFEANCLHFATRFNPKSLFLMFDHMNNDVRNNLIKNTHQNGQYSPLHVAASLDSPCLR